jgi:putative protease
MDELPEPARDFEMFLKTLKQQIAKSGQSIFEFTDIQIDLTSGYFFRMAQLNEIRRNLLDLHQEKRIAVFARKDRVFANKQIPFPKKEVDFRENISNEKAAAFYKQHGVDVIHKALEVNRPEENQLLMTTRYCVKFELGACQRYQKEPKDLQEPLYLEDNNRRYRLHFDCINCMMQIRFAT